MDIISKNKLPEEVELSPDIKERAFAYILIKLYGLYFYIPITKELKKLFKISTKGTRYIFPSYVFETRLERFFRDFINIMYLQIRSEVGDEVHASLSQELKEGFSNLFDNYLNKRIVDKFDAKQIILDKSNNLNTTKES